jgi:hypothetical protein
MRLAARRLAPALVAFALIVPAPAFAAAADSATHPVTVCAVLADGGAGRSLNPLQFIMGSRTRLLQIGAAAVCLSLWVIWWRRGA